MSSSSFSMCGGTKICKLKKGHSGGGIYLRHTSSREISEKHSADERKKVVELFHLYAKKNTELFLCTNRNARKTTKTEIKITVKYTQLFLFSLSLAALFARHLTSFSKKKTNHQRQTISAHINTQNARTKNAKLKRKSVLSLSFSHQKKNSKLLSDDFHRKVSRAEEKQLEKDVNEFDKKHTHRTAPPTTVRISMERERKNMRRHCENKQTHKHTHWKWRERNVRNRRRKENKLKHMTQSDHNYAPAKCAN